MIRLNKPVKLLEWGEGTNTLNQNWHIIGEGKIEQAKQKDGATTLTVTMSGPFNKKNKEDNAIKVVQEGEGMTTHSTNWGEVAVGTLESVDGARVSIHIATAAKLSKIKF